MFHTRDSRHTQSVLSTLSKLVRAAQIQTPSGASMLPARGLFPRGSAVMAPGIDECSPRQLATVVSTGVREGWEGRWCLVRFRDRMPASALVREEDLIHATDDDVEDVLLRSAGRAFATHTPVMVRLP